MTSLPNREFRRDNYTMKKSFSKRQRQIIEVTMNLIQEQGLVAATTRNIAAKLQIKEPSLYRHFANKKAIFEGMCDVVEEYYHDFENQIETIQGSPLDIIGSAFILRSKVFSEHPHLGFLITNSELVFQAYGDLRKRVGELRKNDYTGIIKAIEKGQSQGIIRKDLETENIAAMIGGSFIIAYRNTIDYTTSPLKRYKSVWQDLRITLVA